MVKKTLVSSLVACALLFGISAAPASALTIDEIQSQIQSLLSKVTELTNQLNALRGQSSVDGSADNAISVYPLLNKHRVCNVLYRNLSAGIQGDDVASLQEFLKSEGYLSANATGYFGPMTAQAVAKWQTSQGVSAVGAFGPMSRERIKIWCGGGGGGGDDRFGAIPSRGTAPLTVTFKTNVELPGQYIADANSYKIVFGDGQQQDLKCEYPWSEIQGGVAIGGMPCRSGPISHTYTADGTYIASLVSVGGFCAYPCPETVVAKVQINVGQNVGCTKEYKPVCGSHQIYCITTPCNPIQQTYSNSCMMAADGATFVHEGQCRADYSNPADDPQCKAWNNGCNVCSRQYPGGPAMCTMRACIDDNGNQTPNQSIPQGKGFCTAYFDNSGNKPPTISGFSGPTTLSVNSTGTWTINASDPEGGQLIYEIRWGDEAPYPMWPIGASSIARDFVQSTTFTHAYSSAGTYTVSIVVRDSAGQEAKTSTTVKVGSDVDCTLEYAPVCGQPPRCFNGVCLGSLQMPQTYSNRCFMNAAGASFLYSGQCAGNAY